MRYLRGWFSEPRNAQQQHILNCLTGETSEPFGSSTTSASSSTSTFAVNHATGWSPLSSPKAFTDAWTNPSKFSVKHRLIEINQPDPSKLQSRVVKTYYLFNISLTSYENLFGAWLASTNIPKFFAVTHETISNELPSYFKHYLSFHTVEFEYMVRRNIYYSKQLSTFQNSPICLTVNDDCFEALGKELRAP